MSLARLFVVPALDGPLTGGTLYNRELCVALSELGEPLRVRALEAADLPGLLSAAHQVWVDSLYLEQLPGLARQAPGKVCLLVHYLPSFLRLGRAASSEELSACERAALTAAHSFLVTSAYMREALEPLVAPQKKIVVVTPGSCAQLSVAPKKSAGALSGLLIGNVVPGKGIEALLLALAERLRDEDSLHLSVIGSLQADAAYAARCSSLCASSPALARSVSFAGSLTPRQVARALADAQLLVSASIMESYGMALADARIAGIPILARAGGNVAAHVSAEAGGQLVHSAAELASVCVERTRDPIGNAQRSEQARARAYPERPWQHAARELVDQLGSLEK